jgi:hypothetical protein
MKKINLLALFALFNGVLFSQINLEHTYNVNANSSYVSAVEFATDGYKYVVQEPSLNEIRIYNLNHSLWKTIPIPTVTTHTIVGVYSLSQKLFDENDLI